MENNIENSEYIKSDNISINHIEEDINTINTINTIDDTDFLKDGNERENLQNTEFDKYRNLLNIFNKIELESIQFKNESSLATPSFNEWFRLISREVGCLSWELNNLPSNNNDTIGIRFELIKLAAIVVSWLETLKGE